MRRDRCQVTAAAVTGCMLLILIAGCGGDSSSSAPTPTPAVSPTERPTPTPASTGSPDSVVFSPAVIRLTASGAAGVANAAASEFSIEMNAFDAGGNPIIPDAGNPIHVDVYGAPSGVITPVSATITSGSTFTFAYSGASFPNNISLNAWIGDRSTGGAAIGQTQILLRHPTCSFGGTSYAVPLVSTLPGALKIMGAVGYLDANSANPNLTTYTIDTGSLGTIVTAADLPKSDGINALVIGPAGPGAKCYNSSNNAFFGNYYLAPVDIQVTSGKTTTAVQTNPLIVLAVDKFCKVDSCKTLANPHDCTSKFEFHYMGVGFNRNSSAAGNLFDGPTANAFLHVTDGVNGTDIGPGYVLNTGGVTLGIDSTAGYNTIQLTANASVPGDWEAQPACYGFPQLRAPNQFCGTGLLDVGIDQMFIDLPFARRPPKTFDSKKKVPANLSMNVLMGSAASPAASYTYTTVQPPTSPSGPAPTYSGWIDTTKTGSVFVNTGRNPLNCYDYLYAGQCGEVGFHKVMPSPPGCSEAN